MIFGVTVIILVVFVIAGLFFPGVLSGVTNTAFRFVIDRFGWFYLGSVLFILLFSIVIAASKYGRMKLGKDTDTPEYSRFTWFAMLFSAGMGIGLVFWGTAEPVSHYLSPPGGTAPSSPEALALAFRYSFLHWGFHPWAVYAVIGLGLGWSVFRKDRPFMISSILRPLMGRSWTRPAGTAVDIITLLVTFFGVAASLGMGALQIASGLEKLFGLPNGIMTQAVIITVITVIFIPAAVTGINRGIKYLSNINIAIAVLLLAYLFFCGPHIFYHKNFFYRPGRLHREHPAHEHCPAALQ